MRTGFNQQLACSLRLRRLQIHILYVKDLHNLPFNQVNIEHDCCCSRGILLASTVEWNCIPWRLTVPGVRFFITSVDCGVSKQLKALYLLCIYIQHI